VGNSWGKVGTGPGVENNVCEKGRRQEQFFFQCEVEEWDMVCVCVCVCMCRRLQKQQVLQSALRDIISFDNWEGKEVKIICGGGGDIVLQFQLKCPGEDYPTG
jgi:hypothetical protein